MYLDKYTNDENIGFLLKADNLERLEPEDDVASVLSGGEWHIPTAQDFEELMEKCNKKTVTVKGVTGMEFESKVPGFEGKKIFIPFSGCMMNDKVVGVGQEFNLWSSTAVANNGSRYLFNWNDTLAGPRKRSKIYVITEVELYSVEKKRDAGMSVRPVKTHDADKFASISLPDEHLDLHYGELRPMKVNMMPSGRPVNEGEIVWSTTNADVATVVNGYLTAVGTGSCEISASTAGYEDKMTVTVTMPVPEPVDLGLSVKWASANLGASDQNEAGAFFAWGETKPKAGYYSGKNYRFGEFSNQWSKYNMGFDIFFIGKYPEPDYKETLDPEDDAAAVLLGDGWRMPTADELWELRNKCTWTRVQDTIGKDRNGYLTIQFQGYKITSNVPGSDPELVRSVASKNTKTTHEYVDLGLSIKWATCNVGADKPEENGILYAWGETEPKNILDPRNWMTGKWGNVMFGFTKYNTNSEYGTVDNKTTLDPEDDVAHVIWGGKWRMPTKQEMVELLDNCTWEWTTLNGVNGYRVTSKKQGYTNRSIFLPASGHALNLRYEYGSRGSYWSSTIEPLNDGMGSLSCHSAAIIDFSSRHAVISYGSRESGYSIRPVCP